MPVQGRGGGGGAPGWLRARRWCLLGLAAALTSLALPLLTPWWLGFDVFSQFTVQFAIAAMACAVGLLLPRHRLKIVLALMLAGLAGVGIYARLHAAPGAPPPADGAIRVMSFNTWAGNEDLQAIRAEVLRQRPDIVGMMEFVPPKKNLRGLLRAQYPHAADCNDLPHCYLAFFSRWPVQKVKARSLWEGPPYLHVKVQAPGGAVHVFVVHTLRFPWLGSQLKQVKAMRRVIRRVKGPVIVIGDFNSTPFSVMHRALLRDTQLKRLTFLPSWPSWMAGLPQIAIDHIFVSPHWRLARGPFIGAAAGSDHYPVIVDLHRLATP